MSFSVEATGSGPLNPGHLQPRHHVDLSHHFRAHLHLHRCRYARHPTNQARDYHKPFSVEATRSGRLDLSRLQPRHHVDLSHHFRARLRLRRCRYSQHPVASLLSSERARLLLVLHLLPPQQICSTDHME
ncbi:hypothetical protein QYF36_021010 [Acer negundo]|nr:hypothetical protein QYF36_021010 [Acer negundo]